MSNILIEDVIKEKLIGETQENILNFVAWMQENEFDFKNLRFIGTELRGHASYKSKGFASIMISDQFVMWIGLSVKFHKTEDDEIKDLAWSHVVNCPQVEHDCNPPHNRSCKRYHCRWKVFGKEFPSTCHAPLAFFGPDTEALEKLKKLLVLIR